MISCQIDLLRIKKTSLLINFLRNGVTAEEKHKLSKDLVLERVKVIEIDDFFHKFLIDIKNELNYALIKAIEENLEKILKKRLI